MLPFADGAVTCPIDGAAMSLQPSGSLACERGHSFDRAGAGYYNLLVVQHKASRDPGDSKPMVAARRRVLDSGLYQPIADAAGDDVVAAVSALPDGREARILDAGCGEGTYLANIAERLLGPVVAPLADGGLQRRRCHLAGIDISKWAVQAAAKRTSRCFWAVGTNRHLPFAPGSLDVIVCMFGFPVWEEFAKALAPGGVLLMADPGPEHLIEMRSIIYPQVTKDEGTPALAAGAARAGWGIAAERRLTFEGIVGSPGLIADLLAMTPHGHRAPMAGRQALAALPHLKVTADVWIRQLVMEAL